MRLILTLEYDGTPFRGWAVQPELPTVEGALRAALAETFASVVRIRPCSMSEHVRFEYSAFRCDESRPSFFPVRACRMPYSAANPPEPFSPRR